MGWLGKKSIDLTLSKFSEYWIDHPEEQTNIRTSVADQLGNLIGIMNINFSDYKKSREGLTQLLMDVAAIIPAYEAKKMAKANIQVGENLESKTGSTALYFSHAIFGAYYQGIAETNVRKNLTKSPLKQVRDMMPLLKASKQVASVIYKD